MKWFFFLLLLANIGLFIWTYPQLSETEERSRPSEDAKVITLLSEVKKISDALPDKAEMKTENVSAKGESEVLEKQLPVPARVPVEKEIEAQTQAVELLGKEEATEKVVEPTLVLQCRTIGPLVKRADADKLSLRLRAMGLQPNLNSESTNDQEGYWVVVPPQKTRAEAVATVKRLQKAGITDLWRFTSGKLARAISLGLFRDQARAEVRRQSIAEKGFNVEVRPRYRQKTNYWLSFSFIGESPVSEAKWSEVIKIYPGIERRSVDCLEIATE